MPLKSGEVYFPMMTTASKALLFLLLIFVLGGCALFQVQKKELSVMQQAVRDRLLKLQVTEFLAQTAKEHFQSEKAVALFSLNTGYRDVWSVEKDPALEVLEEAIRYGLTVLSSDPQGTAEKLIGAKLDFLTACALLNLKNASLGSSDGNYRDHLSALGMMTGWESKKILEYAVLPLEEGEVSPFRIDPVSERLLDEKGNGAAFDAASELYRRPDVARLRRAELLRRAMLNRYLLQIKSSGSVNFPELKIAVWRGKLFSEFFKDL